MDDLLIEFYEDILEMEIRRLTASGRADEAEALHELIVAAITFATQGEGE